MIQDVDKSTVLDSGVIDSPVMGKIPPTSLSGGVKTLILMKNEPEKIFNASACGDNCAKWILHLAAILYSVACEGNTRNLSAIQQTCAK